MLGNIGTVIALFVRFARDRPPSLFAEKAAKSLSLLLEGTSIVMRDVDRQDIRSIFSLKEDPELAAVGMRVDRCRDDVCRPLHAPQQAEPCV